MKDKDYKSISKQPDVPVTRDARNPEVLCPQDLKRLALLNFPKVGSIKFYLKTDIKNRAQKNIHKEQR